VAHGAEFDSSPRAERFLPRCSCAACYLFPALARQPGEHRERWVFRPYSYRRNKLPSSSIFARNALILQHLLAGITGILMGILRALRAFHRELSLD